MKSCKEGHYYCYTESKCKKIPAGYRVGMGGYLRKEREDEKQEIDEKRQDDENGWYDGFRQRFHVWW